MPKISLYPHQKEAIEKLRSGSILYGGVGSGKSRAALAYYWKYETDRMRRPKPLYIITTARKRDSLDWESEALYFELSRDPVLSRSLFIVDSWNNIKKYEEVSGAFFIFDEQRVVGSGAWVKSFLKIAKKNRWILLSATPGDTWLDYIPVFIANGFYKNKTEFMRRHVVFSRFSKYPKVERFLDEERLEANKTRILVPMESPRLCRRHPILVDCEYNAHQFLRIFRGRWNVFDDRPIQQAGEWCYLLRRCVNSDPSRLAVVKEVFQHSVHQRVIIFYNFDYELEILREGLSEWVVGQGGSYAEYNGHRHDALPTTDKWVYLVQYAAGNEAWNCITTNAMIFYSLNYSYKVMEQAAGRIDRSNTPYTDLYYYILKSKSSIDKSILLALKNKRKFNENNFWRNDNDTCYQRREDLISCLSNDM